MRNTLLEMLSYRRPMGSATERQFRATFLHGLPGIVEDAHQNLHVAIGDSSCLWACHTDTVHRTEGRQRIVLDSGHARVAARSHSNCLGADDTVGVYLMREMILQKVPGYYIFHYGEERGGIGSSDLARHDAEWLKQFSMAIALDRQGLGDIITHQVGGRTASEAFALSLGDQLGLSGLHYRAAHGIYTDTAEYAGLIAECTNLSVGYYGQHTPSESVNLAHVDRLFGALCDLDPDQLVIAREPNSWEDLGRYVDSDYEDPDNPDPDLVDPWWAQHYRKFDQRWP